MQVLVSVTDPRLTSNYGRRTTCPNNFLAISRWLPKTAVAVLLRPRFLSLTTIKTYIVACLEKVNFILAGLVLGTPGHHGHHGHPIKAARAEKEEEENEYEYSCDGLEKRVIVCPIKLLPMKISL